MPTACQNFRKKGVRIAYDCRFVLAGAGPPPLSASAKRQCESACEGEPGTTWPDSPHCVCIRDPDRRAPRIQRSNIIEARIVRIETYAALSLAAASSQDLILTDRRKPGNRGCQAPRLFARSCDRRHRHTVFNHGRAAGGLTDAEEVNSAVDAPDESDPQRQERLHLGAIAHEGAYHIEGHAGQVGEQSEDRDQQMANHLEVRMTVIADDAS